MSDIAMTVHTPEGKIHDVDTPPDIKVAEIVEELVDSLRLPKTGADGHPIHWILVDKSTGLTLDFEKTLAENGVQRGHSLHLDMEQRSPRFSYIKVQVHLPNGDTSPEDVRADQISKELIAHFILKFKLTKKEALKDEAVWNLDDKDTGKTLDPQKSLHENGVLNGHHLYLRLSAPIEPVPISGGAIGWRGISIGLGLVGLIIVLIFLWHPLMIGPTAGSKVTADAACSEVVEEVKQNPTGNQLAQLLNKLQGLESEYPIDFCFPYERAKLIVFGKAEHHEAFEVLFVAAEKAKKGGQATAMLDKLKKDGEEGGPFHRLTHGHPEWNKLLSLLDREQKVTADAACSEVVEEVKQNPTGNQLAQLLNKLQGLESEYPIDFCFSYERAKLVVFGKAEHHEAFEVLFVAAEKAKKGGQATAMLDKLKKDGEEGGPFHRLTHGHPEWNKLLSLLDREQIGKN
jgi:hypothetical protein